MEGSKNVFLPESPPSYFLTSSVYSTLIDLQWEERLKIITKQSVLHWQRQFYCDLAFCSSLPCTTLLSNSLWSACSLVLPRTEEVNCSDVCLALCWGSENNCNKEETAKSKGCFSGFEFAHEANVPLKIPAVKTVQLRQKCWHLWCWRPSFTFELQKQTFVNKNINHAHYGHYAFLLSCKEFTGTRMREDNCKWLEHRLGFPAGF